VVPMDRSFWKLRYSMLVVAVCEQKAPVHCTVFNCVRSVKCGTKTVQPSVRDC
jgi:hypothetical protein